MQSRRYSAPQRMESKKKEYTGREIEKKVTSAVKTKNISFWTEEEINKYRF